ncbi:MAG: DUF1272 domain-containing protein [Pseudomonadota bacterium]
MLEMRPNCECCDVDLPLDAHNAMVCTFECTFCADCSEQKLSGTCPNCGGELCHRPRRPKKHWESSPASTKRVLKPQGCLN